MRKHPRFGLSRAERYQLQIKALQKEINKLRQRQQQLNTFETQTKYLIEKDKLVVKLKNKIRDLEKKLGNKVYEVLCSQHGFDFSYTTKCPTCEKKHESTKE